MALVADYDSDSSDEGQVNGSKQKASVVLPSASSLLEENSFRGPSYLQQSTSVAEVDYKKLSDELEKEQLSKDSSSLENGTDTSLAGNKLSLAGTKRPLENDETSVANMAEKRSQAAMLKAIEDDNKKTVAFKDRAKHQRLSGQSGIGADFRTWRTDEEMALRQQFDS